MRIRSALLAAACALVVLVAGAGPAGALSSSIVISQVYGGGGNSGAQYNADYVELFNRGTTPVSVAGWSIQYTSATGTGDFGANSGQLAELPDVTVQPGRYLLVQMSSAGTTGAALPEPRFTDPTPVNMSGTGGKVALATGTTTLGCNGSAGRPCDATALARIVDLVGYGTANFYETAPAPALSNTTAAFRAGSGCAETDDNSADFTAGAPQPRTSATAPHFCDAENAPSVSTTSPGTGATGVARTANITVNFSEDVLVGSGWYAIACATTGPHAATQSGGPRSFTLDPTTDFATGETCTVTIDGDLVSDVDALDPPDTMASDHSWSFTVFAPPPVSTIGSVQGPVSDTANGATHTSPKRNQVVTVRGVIYQQTLARTSSGGSLNGFFIQNTAATADTDATTSDGIFVYMDRFTDLTNGYVPRVGDEVVITGTVREDFSFTRLEVARLEELVRTGVDLGAELAPFVANPPDDLAAANRYWERREGMRGQVPAGSVAVDGRDVFPSTADGEVWVIRGDHPVAQRANPYARRVFRDPHPLDNNPDQLFDDGNGYRIMMASLGLKAATGDNSTLIAPSRTFDRMTNAPVGGVYFSFSKYSIQVGEQPVFANGVEPARNAPPQAPNRAREYSVADYNVENLYDFRDDPNDGCDFATNTGCPGVNPPFDYVPANDAVYQARLREIARQIVGDLHAPDLILVQEAEDQDICTVESEALSCGTADNRDGKPDTLQELTLAIREVGGPAYDAVYDRNGADDRGIVSAFLYRTDRVELRPTSVDELFGATPDVTYRSAPLAYNADVQNPKSLNAVLPADVDRSTGTDGGNVYTRAPQVGAFRIWRVGVGRGVFVDLYAISNHFSSTPDRRVGQRREQAAYNAAIVEALSDSGSRILTGGDFNVFPRPDDPFSPGHVQYPSDQLAPLYNAGLASLWSIMVAEVPAAAYSYVFTGQTQTLDSMFVTDVLEAELVQARVAHVNADYPADYEGDGPRGLSDHDPMSSRFAIPGGFGSLEALLAYYRDSGAITGKNTYEQLLGHLRKAQKVGDAQLRAFINQVRGKSPRFVTPTAADALVAEAELLRESS